VNQPKYFAHSSNTEHATITTSICGEQDPSHISQTSAFALHGPNANSSARSKEVEKRLIEKMLDHQQDSNTNKENNSFNHHQSLNSID
jgi:hypothetical protein